MGGDTSGKTSTTNANMNSQSGQNVWGQQGDQLGNMYGAGNNLMNNTLNGANQNQQNSLAMGQNYANSVQNDVYNPLLGSFQNAFGAGNASQQAANGVVNPMVSGLTNIMGNSGPTFAEGGYNPLLDQSVSTGLDQTSSNFQRNIAPSIKRNAVAQGQYGGTRGDLALGTAAGDANKQALASAMGAYQNQYQGDRAANLQSQMANNQMRLGAAQQMGGLISGNSANTMAGVNGAQNLMNTGMAGSTINRQLSNQQWDPINNQRGTLGGPQVLGNTSATGTSGSTPIFNPLNGGGGSKGGGGLPGMGSSGKGGIAGGSGGNPMGGGGGRGGFPTPPVPGKG